MLTQPGVVPYLLQRDLLQAQTVVAGDLRVVDASRRNANFKVISEAGPSYLLKQGVGPERAATLAQEAAIYRRLHGMEASRALRRYLPRLFLYSAAEPVLVLELWPAAENFGEYHRRRGRFSPALAAALGRVLGRLHQLPCSAGIPGSAAAFPPCAAPWVLAIHRPTPALYVEISAANVQLIRVIQRFPEFGALLDALGREWRPSALVHYDGKWENLLVVPAGPGRRGRLKLVDWELAGSGDPCWDVGTIFGEYLGFWLRSIPLTGEDPPDRFLDLARYPLSKIQPALRSFWRAYAQQMQLTDQAAAQWLGRAVRYGAARLIQTAFEEGQTADQLTGNVLCFLQLSFNMLQRPVEAAVHLLGIPWPPGPAA